MLIEIGHVEAIFRYPVKSMGGERVEVAQLGAVAHGYSVMISNSRDPETLAALVKELGPRARAATSVEAADGEIVVVTIPLKNISSVPVEPLAGKVVIDTNNYYPQRDGQIPELDDESAPLRCFTTHDAGRLAFEDHSGELGGVRVPGLSAGFGDATLRERYRCSKTNQEGNGRGEVYESRPLTRELETSAVVGDQPDGGGRKEPAELDGDALKLTILKPRA